jgi:hypothetical protein
MKAVTGTAGTVPSWQRHTVTDFDGVECPSDLRQVVFQGHSSRSMWNATMWLSRRKMPRRRLAEARQP